MLKPILLVEDNEDDVVFMKRALKAAGIPNSLQVAPDGQEALEYLGGFGDFADRTRFPLAGLVLLDLKLPRKSGLDLLRWIREQPALRTLVVLVLTTSREPSDMRRACELGANAFLVKPPAYQELVELVRAIKAFWLGFNEFVPPE